jgi:hypothetical protein
VDEIPKTLWTKSLNSPELSINPSSQKQFARKLQKQEDYGISKTEFLGQSDLVHFPNKY